MKKRADEMLTINRNSQTGLYFVMNNQCLPQGGCVGKIGAYYPSMREATVEMFRLCKNNASYTNIYDMSNKNYSELVAN